MEPKKIIISRSNFKEYIDNNWYFVDKSLLIQKIEESDPVCLITRPRRFGKSLNLSMLRFYYEDTMSAEENQARKALFNGLQIQNAPQAVLEQQCAYPVVHLSFMAGDSEDFDSACDGIKMQIEAEFQRHDYVIDHIRYKGQKDLFIRMVDEKGTDKDFRRSLVVLTKVLARYHKKNVILLIDEYDAPILSAYHNGYYKDMITFIRPIIRDALKENDSLHRAILTGCVRIASDSIFSGLNNPYVNSIFGTTFGEYFGFTQQEIDATLSTYGLEERRDIIKDWYDGYTFCKAKVYNPYSVLSYTRDVMNERDKLPIAYWTNTSSNDYIRDMLIKMNGSMNNILESLMNGDSVSVRIMENLNFRDLFESTDVVLNMLLFAGYLKAEEIVRKGDRDFALCVIPNKEVRQIYETEISNWVETKIQNMNFVGLYGAFESGDVTFIENCITHFLETTISVRDKKEDYYHGVLTGILGGLIAQYKLFSNAESGAGYSDILLWTEELEERLGIVIEVKYTKTKGKMTYWCNNALGQIEKKKYVSKLLQEKCVTIRKYGFCFCGKQVKVLAGVNS